MIRNVIAIAAISLTLTACGHTGSSYERIPGVINVVSVDAQGRAIFTPLAPARPHVWGDTEGIGDSCFVAKINC